MGPPCTVGLLLCLGKSIYMHDFRKERMANKKKYFYFCHHSRVAFSYRAVLWSPPVRSRPAHRRGGLEFRSTHLLAVLCPCIRLQLESVCELQGPTGSYTEASEQSNWVITHWLWLSQGSFPLPSPQCDSKIRIATEKPQDVKKEDRGSHLSLAFPSCMILDSSFIHGPNGHHSCPTYFPGYSQEKMDATDLKTIEYTMGYYLTQNVTIWGYLPSHSRVA